jgi:nucleoside-diphosphate-sugar epimerase
VNGRRVVITGASGFVGKRLAAACVARGDRVVCLLREGSELPAPLAATVEAIRAIGTDPANMAAAVMAAKPDIVFNLAAYGVAPSDRDAGMADLVNRQLPVALLRAAAAVGAPMVHAGSSAEYAPGAPGRLLREMDPLESEKLYGRSKAEGGEQVVALAGALEARVAILRLFNVFGPGEASHRLLPSLLSGLGAGQRVALSPGTQKRDFVFVDDAVDAMLAAGDALAISSRPARWIANVCTGEALSVADFACMVAAEAGFSESLLGFGEIPIRPDDLPWVVGDPGLTRSLFGWSFSHSVAQGIVRSIGFAL